MTALPAHRDWALGVPGERLPVRRPDPVPPRRSSLLRPGQRAVPPARSNRHQGWTKRLCVCGQQPSSFRRSRWPRCGGLDRRPIPQRMASATTWFSRMVRRRWAYPSFGPRDGTGHCADYVQLHLRCSARWGGIQDCHRNCENRQSDERYQDRSHDAATAEIHS
jgi:hypothetical protein